LKFFLFLFSFLFLYSFELNVNYYKDKNRYEILTLYNNEPFLCKKKGNNVICKFNKVPSTPTFKSNTIFFKITPIFKKRNFYLLINVKGFYEIKSFEDNLYNNSIITPFKIKKAKKWVIIASDKKISNPKNNGLKFYFHHSFQPFIGPIDDNGNPIDVNRQSEDVLKYFEILNAYKRGKDVSMEIENFIKNYPNSVFLPDVLFLKLKILDKKNESDEVISLAKVWIKKFAFDENLPKVLLLLANNYSKIGFLSDAAYLYQRIITEYPNTKEAYLAMIYLADQLYTTGDDKTAFKYYKKALYSTNDIEIASLAASRLAQRYMDKGNIKKSIEYYMKIYIANKNYLLKDKQKAYELAKTLASHNAYDLATKIGEDLIKRLKKLDDIYESLEYNLVNWYYDMKNYKKALFWIEKYLNDFPYGTYSDAVADLRDKVIFEVDDKNLTKQLQVVDEILKKYNQGDIANKALYKKVMILYKLKKYNEIIKMEDKIKNIPEEIFKNKKEFLEKVYKEYVIELLNKNRCFEAINLIKTKKLTLYKKYDDKVYECAIKTKNYNIASIVCNKYLDSPDDKIFIKWMKRKIEALEGLKDYANIVLAVDDLCNVMKKGCYEYKLKKFFALWKLQRYKEALVLAKELDKVKDIRNTDAFIKIVNYALKNNDNLLAATYAKKIIDLQNRFKAYPYSPFVEFTYAKFSKNKKEAIKVLKDVLNRVSGEDKARAYFMLANLTKDKQYIDKCLQVKDSKLWRGLCEDAKDLF
jgi:tetratricopeptide (TPR) repeat protein